MKTTLEIPDQLMRDIQIRAAKSNRGVKDTVADLIRRGLESSSDEAPSDPLQAFMKKLIFHSDGTVTNPDGIDDPEFFNALEEVK